MRFQQTSSKAEGAVGARAVWSSFVATCRSCLLLRLCCLHALVCLPLLQSLIRLFSVVLSPSLCLQFLSRCRTDLPVPVVNLTRDEAKAKRKEKKERKRQEQKKIQIAKCESTDSRKSTTLQREQCANLLLTAFLSPALRPRSQARPY
jgi:hypothetical protein